MTDLASGPPVQPPLFDDCALQSPAASVGNLAVPAEAVTAVRTGRKPRHSSGADRVKAHRAKLGRIDALIPLDQKATIASIASNLDCSESELTRHLIRFALTNRNWRQCGLMGASR